MLKNTTQKYLEFTLGAMWALVEAPCDDDSVILNQSVEEANAVFIN